MGCCVCVEKTQQLKRNEKKQQQQLNKEKQQ